ncbi:hypothetical protein MUK42_13928 [Musa troglodytarum]|uniref:Uncharacterized protein n=1 Tax=Musa troglodytarum TaxID=320322 RepID=A0A9E7KU25_9LILI|nr:hypothetical protein MUK42_13928 [Musa troglodytarum]
MVMMMVLILSSGFWVPKPCKASVLFTPTHVSWMDALSQISDEQLPGGAVHVAPLSWKHRINPLWSKRCTLSI